MRNYKTEIKWAAIFIVMSLAWMYLEKALGWHDEKIALHPYLTMLYMFPAILVYVLALREKRDKDLNGKMSWKQGFLSGMLVSIIVAAFSPISMYVTQHWITPDYFPNAIEYAVNEQQLTLEAAQDYFSYKSYVVQSVIGAIIMGLITSSIVAAIVKRS